MLHPTLAPSLGITASNLVTVTRRTAYNTEGPYDLLVVQAGTAPMLVIDADGTGRLIRHKNTRWSFQYTYISARRFHLPEAFSQPLGVIVSFYEKAVATLTEKQKAA